MTEGVCIDMEQKELKKECPICRWHLSLCRRRKSEIYKCGNCQRRYRRVETIFVSGRTELSWEKV